MKDRDQVQTSSSIYHLFMTEVFEKGFETIRRVNTVHTGWKDKNSLISGVGCNR